MVVSGGSRRSRRDSAGDIQSEVFGVDVAVLVQRHQLQHQIDAPQSQAAQHDVGFYP